MAAKQFAAVGTDPLTLLADGVAAVAAVAGILAIHHIAAIAAGRAVPIGQRDVGTVRVVRRQDTADHGEKVREAALFQCRPYGRTAIAFTEHLVTDVRMRDRRIIGRRVGIQGPDAVRSPLVHLAQVVQAQSHLKPAEIDFFERDRFSDDAQGAVLTVELDVVELLLQGSEFLDDF